MSLPPAAERYRYTFMLFGSQRPIRKPYTRYGLSTHTRRYISRDTALCARGQTGRLHSGSGARRCRSFRHLSRYDRRRAVPARRCVGALLDTIHYEGLLAGGGARLGGRSAVEQGRARAVGYRVQLPDPARSRARHPAQSVHQCRRYRRGGCSDVALRALRRGLSRFRACHKRQPDDRLQPRSGLVGARNGISQPPP